ncbi:MAG TPA: ribbon-helix-helix domain-containing protein, partial [Bacteroidales bacterium]|nr:ribbon-helix-helix domain-containing protein [Bacteroidales bacterium]
MFTTTLKKELYDILRNMSKATGIPMTRLLDEAVTHLIEARNDQYVSA